MAFNILLAFALALFFNQGTASRFSVLVDNALRLASDKELNPTLNGTDEIARMDRAFRNMAAALQTMRKKERDISERKEIERLKQDFVTMVSHDLRTPLTAIQMVHDLLQAEAYGELSPAGHERLSDAEGNVQRLMTLVNGLLDLEKIESGQLELSCENVPVDVILGPAMKAVAGLAQKHGVAVVRGPSPSSCWCMPTLTG